MSIARFFSLTGDFHSFKELLNIMEDFNNYLNIYCVTNITGIKFLATTKHLFTFIYIQKEHFSIDVLYRLVKYAILTFRYKKYKPKKSISSPFQCLRYNNFSHFHFINKAIPLNIKGIPSNTINTCYSNGRWFEYHCSYCLWTIDVIP